jgi:hypothetical protein
MYIYIHVTCLNHYKDVFEKIINKIKDSGLYDNVTKIFVSIIGNSNLIIQDPKVEILYRGPLGQYEVETINRINVPDDNLPILYLHSKGVTKPHIKQINDWTDLMLYYLIDEWKMCLECLKEYDTVGVNLHSKPIPGYSGNYVHYSGNMWWTTGKHLKNIGKLHMKTYLDSEMYICKKGNHLGLWDSKVNHYFEYYPPENYRGKVEPYNIKN